MQPQALLIYSSLVWVLALCVETAGSLTTNKQQQKKTININIFQVGRVHVLSMKLKSKALFPSFKFLNACVKTTSTNNMVMSSSF